MDAFLQRMIQRFQDQFLQRMSPERRALKISVMKALARESLRSKRIKENKDSLNNNMTLPFNLKHSTPLKCKQITDLDAIESETESVTENEGTEFSFDQETYEILEEKSFEKESTEPQLLVTKIYDLVPVGENSLPQTVDVSAGTDQYEVNVREAHIDQNTVLEKDERHWKALEVLDESAEYEFCRSLEESKLFLSTSNLLEEIEADLPTSYSLARPFNHSFNTITSYRTITRLARMDVNLTCPEVFVHRESIKKPISMKKKENLEMEATVQKVLAKQAEKALNLSKTKKFFGVEHLESERTLLLANLRYEAANQELEKLKMLGEIPDKEDFGQVTITDIFFSVENLTENVSDRFIFTATEREKVQASYIVGKIFDGELHFNETFTFQNLRKDFTIYIQLFRLHYNETKNAMTTSLIRKLKKMTTVNLNKSLTDSSPGVSGFTCVACADLRLKSITDRENEKCVVNFTEIPQYPVTGTFANLYLKVDLNIKSIQRGFLNVFKQTWHRRWYWQSGYFLDSWLYPEDQDSDKPPVDSVYLPHCISEVRSVGMDVCIRPHSFVIPLGKNYGDVLFAADSQKEMMEWITQLNLIIEHIRLWKPDV